MKSNNKRKSIKECAKITKADGNVLAVIVSQVPTVNSTFFLIYDYHQVNNYFLPIPSKNQFARLLRKIKIGIKLNRALKIRKQKVKLETIIRPLDDLFENQTDNKYDKRTVNKAISIYRRRVE